MIILSKVEVLYLGLSIARANEDPLVGLNTICPVEVLSEAFIGRDVFGPLDGDNAKLKIGTQAGQGGIKVRYSLRSREARKKGTVHFSTCYCVVTGNGAHV